MTPAASPTESIDARPRSTPQHPDRLRGFCGVDPLKSYALAEIDRCSLDPRLHFGLKLHFGNSDVDLGNPDRVAALRKVFQSAAAHHMAIVVHMHASITSHRPYGAKEAQIFVTQVSPQPPPPALTFRSPISPAPADTTTPAPTPPCAFSSAPSKITTPT